MVYDTMICGYCREGTSHRAQRLLKEMRKNGLEPSAASYGLTICTLCNEGKAQEGEFILDDMVACGLEACSSLRKAVSDAKLMISVGQVPLDRSSNEH